MISIKFPKIPQRYSMIFALSKSISWIQHKKAFRMMLHNFNPIYVAPLLSISSAARTKSREAPTSCHQQGSPAEHPSMIAGSMPRASKLWRLWVARIWKLGPMTYKDMPIAGRMWQVAPCIRGKPIILHRKFPIWIRLFADSTRTIRDINQLHPYSIASCIFW